MQLFKALIASSVLLPFVCIGNPITFNAIEKAYLQDHPLIVVGYSADAPPMLMFDENQQVSGILPDIYQLISQRTGIEFSYAITDWNSVLEQTQSGQIDVIPLMDQAPALARDFIVSDWFTTATFAVYAKTGSPSIRSLDDLAGKRVAYRETVVTLHKQLKPHQDLFTLVPLPDNATAFNQLSRGQIDAVIGFSLDGYTIQNRELFDIELVYVPDELILHSVFATKPNDRILHEIMRKAMRSVGPASQFSQ